VLELYELLDARRPQSSPLVGVKPGDVPLAVARELRDGFEPRFTGGPLSTGGDRLLYLSGLGDRSILDVVLLPRVGAGSTLVFRGITLFLIPRPVIVSP